MMIVFWYLVVHGITQIIVESELFKPLRIFLRKFFLTQIFAMLSECMLCTGAWVAFGLSLLWISPAVDLLHLSPLIINGYHFTWFIDGMSGSCAVWFIHVFEKLLLALTSYLKRAGY